MITASVNSESTNDTKDVIRQYIIDNLLLGQGSTLDDDTSLLDSGALDSTAAMELVAFLEQTFNVQIQDREINPDNLETVNRISAMIGRKTVLVAAE
jgi:acyl carrier protein